MLFTADPAWGFRSATAKYYSLCPEAFRRRAAEEGLWMPFTNIAKVADAEDFNFRFQEGAGDIGYDEAHGVYSFSYISPLWAWLWMPERKERPTDEFVQEKLAADLKSEDPAVRRQAQMVVNCSAVNAQGKLHYSIGSAHWAPSKFGPVGWYAMFPANADPDLAQLNRGPTTGEETMKRVEELVARYNRPEAFIDGFYFDGVDERPLDNYAREQFPFAESPLTIGTDTKRPILCGAFSSYKFLKRVAERMHATGRLTMANGVPSQFPFSAGYLDAGGAELEPSIENDPVTLGYLTYARTLLYHKPLLLLYKPRLEERFDRDLSPYLVDYMNACLPYAAEPSLFKIFSNTNVEFYHSFFERPDWYNRYRPIFVEYLPLVRRLALAGWEPVTHARASDARVIVERFGSGANLNFVVYNPLREGPAITIKLDVALGELGWARDAQACVANLADAALVPSAQTARGLTLTVAVPPRRAAVLAVRDALSRLGAWDVDEAGRHLQIAGSRLQDKLTQKLPIDFEADPEDDGVPTGFTTYKEGTVSYASDRTVFHSAPRATRAVLSGKARATQSTTVALGAARKIRVSMWAKATFAAAGSLHFYFRWRDKTNKDLGMVTLPGGLSASSDWRQLQHEASAPAEATAVELVMVATTPGPGDATVWFDDPTIVGVGEGKEEGLLPLTRKAVPPSAPAMGRELVALQETVKSLADGANKGETPPTLCSLLLTRAAELEQRRAALVAESADWLSVAAAVGVAGGRLGRAASVLTGWQMALEGGGNVSEGEDAHLTAVFTAGALAMERVRLAVMPPEGWQLATAPGEVALVPAGESSRVSLHLTRTNPTAPGGSVAVTATAQLADGHTLPLRREGVVKTVPACETTLARVGETGGGRTQRLLLSVENCRQERALDARIVVTPPRGFTAPWADKTVSLKAGEEARVPLDLTAAEGEKAGWRTTRVTVSWEGQQRVHEQPALYVPPQANLLTNGGFEQEAGGQAAAWGRYAPGGYARDHTVVHSGKSSLRVSATGQVKTGGASQRLVLAQKTARPLVVHGWSRYQKPGGDAQQITTIGMTENALTPAASRGPNYSLYVDLHFVGGGALYGQVATFDKSITDWQFSEKVISVAKPVQDATLYVLFRDQEGTAWFDDLLLAEADPNLALTPGTTVQADSSYSGYAPAAVIDGVVDTAGVEWSKAAWASADARGEHWVEITLPREMSVSAVVVHWAVDLGATWVARRVVAQAFVGGTWHDAARLENGGEGDPTVLSFEPVATTRVRVLQPDAGGARARPNIMWVREVEVY